MEICEEMKKFRKLLDEKKIRWHDASDELSEIVKICRTHFEYKGYWVSVVNGFGTYGGWNGANYPSMEEKDNLGLLEVKISEEEPVGWLKAEDVIKLIEEIKNDEKDTKEN